MPITDQKGQALSIKDILSASLLTKPRNGFPDYIIEFPKQAFTSVTLPNALKEDIQKPASQRQHEWPYRPPCYLLTASTYATLLKDERFFNAPSDPRSIGNQLAGITILTLTEAELQTWLATLTLRIARVTN